MSMAEKHFIAIEAASNVEEEGVMIAALEAIDLDSPKIDLVGKHTMVVFFPDGSRLMIQRCTRTGRIFLLHGQQADFLPSTSTSTVVH